MHFAAGGGLLRILLLFFGYGRLFVLGILFIEKFFHIFDGFAFFAGQIGCLAGERCEIRGGRGSFGFSGFFRGCGSRNAQAAEHGGWDSSPTWP